MEFDKMKDQMKDKFNETVNKENLDAGKEKLKAGADKVNERIKGLGLRRIVESKVPAETRAKFPILDKIIPLTNYIACGLAALLVVMVVANAGGGNRGGGERAATGERVAAGERTAAAGQAAGGGGRGAARANPYTDFRYDLTSDGKGIVIQHYIGSSGGRVVIPATIEGYPVTEIGPRAFAEIGEGIRIVDGIISHFTNRTVRITEVIIPDTVTVIGNNAFAGCLALSSITLPKSLTTIGFNAFMGAGLTSITIPEGVTIIEHGAFSYNRNLTTITLPESLEELHYAAFLGCSSLTTVNLPRSPFHYVRSGILVPAQFRDSVIREFLSPGSTTRNFAWIDTNNDAFVGTPRLSIASRRAIQESGYTGRFD